MTVIGMTKKYANSQLLCFLEAKTFKCLPNTIEAHHTHIIFFIYWQRIQFIEICVTGMTNYLSDSLRHLQTLLVKSCLICYFEKQQNLKLSFAVTNKWRFKG